MSLSPEEQRDIEISSVPLPEGGDLRHIHPYGPDEQDFDVTTRIPTGDGETADIHDKGEDFDLDND